MNRILTAIALSIALPAAAQAQSAPAPKADCCDKMKGEAKECCCCKDVAGKHDSHAAPHAPGDQHQNHQH